MCTHFWNKKCLDFFIWEENNHALLLGVQTNLFKFYELTSWSRSDLFHETMGPNLNQVKCEKVQLSLRIVIQEAYDVIPTSNRRQCTVMTSRQRQ